MNEGLVPAYAVHAVPGRLRLRIPRKRRDEPYFTNLCAQLSGRRLVVSVSANAVTGGVLLQLTPGVTLDQLSAEGRALALFDLRAAEAVPIRPVPRRNALAGASAVFKGTDRFLAQATGGYLDLKSSVFLVLLVMAARQIVRGEFMVPGFTLLWYALTLMME